MCGRYTLAKPDWFEHDFGTSFATLSDAVRRPRFNIAPGQLVLAIAHPQGSARVAETMKWGVEAPWKGGPPQMINARAEKLATSRLWKSMLENGRCALPADGFYEWRKPENNGGRKQPYWFSRADGEPFLLAGLFRESSDADERQCVVITVEPNELVEDVHDRMPAMLHPDRVDDWLEGDAEEALQALVPFESTQMTARRIGSAVGNVSNDSPELIESIGDQSDESLF